MQMRRGTNPSKINQSTVAPPPLITICFIVHIPNLKGYYRQSLRILKLCIDSVVTNTFNMNEIVIYDNGSCKRVIHFLFMSEKNMGKIGAWNMLFTAARGEFVVYADSDVYFYPSWDVEHLKVFQEFENVGMVTGLPVREKSEFFTKNTLVEIMKIPNVLVEKGKFIKDEFLRDFRTSLGKNPLDYYSGDLKSLIDLRVTKNNFQCFIGASHFQFMSKNYVLRSLFPLEFSKAIGEEKILDKKIDEMKLLRLSTLERHVQHVGNNLYGDIWFENLNLQNSNLFTYFKLKLIRKIIRLYGYSVKLIRTFRPSVKR